MISTSKKFIFIHIPKTAGNSIQEKLYEYSDDKKITVFEQDGVEQFEIVNDDYGINKHASLQNYRDNIHGNRFNSLFKFAVLRNPWDRVVSYYWSPHSERKEWNREEFVKVIQGTPLSENFVCLRGDTGFAENMDFLMKFENLEEYWKELCNRLNIDYSPLNVRNNSNRTYYSEYYDNETRQMVYERFRNEINFAGYEFEDRRTDRKVFTLTGFGGCGLSSLGNYLRGKIGSENFSCIDNKGAPTAEKHEKYPENVYNRMKNNRRANKVQSAFLFRYPVKSLLSLDRRFKNNDMKNHIRNISGYPSNWPGTLELFSEKPFDDTFLFRDFFRRWLNACLGHSPQDHIVRLFSYDDILKSGKARKDFFEFFGVDGSDFEFKPGVSEYMYENMNSIIRNRFEKMFEDLIIEMDRVRK